MAWPCWRSACLRPATGRSSRGCSGLTAPWYCVAPTPAHLGELVPALGLLGVDERKPQRLAAQLDPYFDRLAEHGLDWTMELDHAGVRDLVGMGPSALHTDDEALEKAIAALAEPVHVTGSVSVSVYRRRD